jgi:cobalt/nickel transport system permease protein
MIPDWLKQTEDTLCPAPPETKVRGNFIKKTMDGILGFFSESFVTSEMAGRNGLLQSLDPRIKMISIMLLILSISTLKDLSLLVLAYLMTLVLALSSRIGLIFFIKRVWLFIPIFTGVIALPMTINLVYPGDPLFHLFSMGSNAVIGPLHLPQSVYITKQGLVAATVFTMRVAACVSFVVLLFLTTPQKLLWKSLRSVGVPKMYVLTIEMANRYIFLFMDMIKDLHTAKKSRTIRSGGTWAEQSWVGGRIGYMMVKSLDMSERVHMAMLSRGFSGEVKILHEYSIGARDYAAAATSVMLSALFLLASYGAIRI